MTVCALTLKLKGRKAGIFTAIARLSIGALFIYSSLPKLRQPYDFLGNVYEYELVGPSTGVLVAVVLPWLELVIGICLLGGILVSGAFLLSVALGAVFTFAQASALYRGLGISCGCFASSAGEHTVSYLTLGRAILIIPLALLGYALYMRNSPAEQACLYQDGRPRAE